MDEVLRTLRNPSQLRNVCVIAHVDHGKTSICDHLVAANGYIPAKLAGKTRFMDSRDDEQQRLITIKSSSIPLLYRDAKADKSYIVNLIDSPGHVDFSVEVSAATRLCDNALVVVDVIEGLRSQTKTVLRQGVSEGINLMLVLNKIDRLFCEVNMSPGNAYTHLRDVVENINAYLHKCIQDAYIHTLSHQAIEALYTQMAFDPTRGNVLFCSANDGWCCDLRLIASRVVTQMVAVRPEVSATDRESMIQKTVRVCWGDWTLNSKTGQITKKTNQPSSTIAAMHFMRLLQQIYMLQSEAPDKLPSLVEKASRFLQVNVSDKELKDWLKKPFGIAAALLNKWSPLGSFMLSAVVRYLPSPVQAYEARMRKIMSAEQLEASGILPVSNNPRGEEVLRTAPCLAFVAKSMHASFELERLTGDSLHGRETVNDFVGFCRVFEGSLGVGTVLYVAGNDPTNMEKCKKLRVSRVYIPVGMDLCATDSVGAGAIACIAFDETLVANSNEAVRETVDWLLSLKDMSSLSLDRREAGFTSIDRCVTLSAAPDTRPLVNIYAKHPIGAMKFGVSPYHISNWQDFMRGLALLYRADPAVSIEVVQETGEFIVCCQGEVHHERIVQDFHKLYCPGIELRITPPLVSLRETVVVPPSHLSLVSKAFAVPFPPWVNVDVEQSLSEQAAAWNWSHALTSEAFGGLNSWAKVTSYPMAEELLRFLDEQTEAITDLFAKKIASSRVHQLCKDLECFDSTNKSLDEISKLVLTHVKALSGIPAECVTLSVSGDGRTAAFLVHPEEAEFPPKTQIKEDDFAAELTLDALGTESNLRNDVMNSSISDKKQHALKVVRDHIDHSLIQTHRHTAALCIKHALESVTRRGPLCEEPVRGVCWLVKGMATASQPDAVDDSAESDDATTTVIMGSIGPLIGCLRSAFRESLLTRGCCRIWELMMKLEVSCSETSLGRVHDVISSRRGTVLSQDMLETTLEFVLLVEMPACETYDLTLEMRKHASFIPIKTYWKMNAEDPFVESVITTELEEDEGTAAQAKQNTARKLINEVRERKGLPLGVKVLAEGGGNKQRTLKH